MLHFELLVQWRPGLLSRRLLAVDVRSMEGRFEVAPRRVRQKC